MSDAAVPAGRPQLGPVDNVRPADECLLGRSDEEIYGALATLDWDLEEARTNELTHGLHPYPAKFIPQLPARFIEQLSQPGDLVIDPFCGGGTSGVEAQRLGRHFVGIDANPVGVLLGQVKTTPLPEGDRSQLAELRHGLESGNPPRPGLGHVPPIPNIDKWYAPAIVDRLASIRASIAQMPAGPAQNVALAAFVKVAARVSYQESETRYVSRPRPLDPDAPRRQLLRELDQMEEQIQTLPRYSAPAVFVSGDARVRSSYPVPEARAGLVITSPPYPNAYDYHLYHRFRIFWLGADPAALRRVEVGSHLRHQGDRDPAAAFEADMEAVLENIKSVLAPGRFCAMIVGDGIYRGEKYPTAHRVSEIASGLGFVTLPLISRNLPADRRSVTVAGRRLKHEEIVLMRKPDEARERLTLAAPNYRRFPYEAALAQREIEALTGIAPDHDGCAVTSDVSLADVVHERLLESAFWHGVSSNGQTTPTMQCLLEGAVADVGRRKNSTYLTHGLHRYKGKFYPQLAKALINLSRVERPSGLIVDPFGGSGTVLLESVINGYDALSLDCNPLAVAVARAKVEILRVPRTRVEALSERLVDSLKHWPGREPREVVVTAFEPTVLEELESWFPAPALARLSWLLRSIRSLEDATFIAFCEAAASGLVRDISQQDPRDLRIRRRAEPLVDAPVFEIFEDRLRSAVQNLAAWHEMPSRHRERIGNGIAALGDAADASTIDAACRADRCIAAVVSSPPYATALPYIDTDRLSLAAIFGYDRRQRAQLERSLIGSREVSRSEERAWREALSSGEVRSLLPDSTLTFLLDLMEAVDRDTRAGFRRRQMPAVLLRYFVGMSRVLRNLRLHMRAEAPVWFVLGDSRTTVGGRTWTIPTIDEVEAIAKMAGFEPIERVEITVTREDVVHARNAITDNVILHLSSGDTRTPNGYSQP